MENKHLKCQVTWATGEKTIEIIVREDDKYYYFEDHEDDISNWSALKEWCEFIN